MFLVKGSSSLLVMKEDIVSKLETSACIRCVRCGEGCPSHLLPLSLLVLLQETMPVS